MGPRERPEQLPLPLMLVFVVHSGDASRLHSLMHTSQDKQPWAVVEDAPPANPTEVAEEV